MRKIMRQNQTAELARWRLEECQRIRQYQDQGYLVISTQREFPVPCLYDLPQIQYQGMSNYQCPWGTVEELSYRYYALHLDGHDRAELPPQIARWLDKPIEIAVVTVDAAKRQATVQVAEGGTEVLLTDVPVWESPWALLDRINETLRDQGLAIVCQHLEIDEAEDNDNLWLPGMVPTVHNDHTAVPLTGYAHDGNFLVYLGAVGNKTSLKSIWASAVGNGSRKKSRLYLSLGSSVSYPVQGSEYHSPLWAPLPDQNAYHLTLLSRAATEANVQDGVGITYLPIWDSDGDPQTTARKLLVERLDAALPIPVLPEWADALWDAAEDQRWLAEMATGGDCRAGYRLTINVEAWIKLIQEMVEQETLTF